MNEQQRDNADFYALATAAIAATDTPAIVNAWEDARAHVAAGEDDKARTRLRYAQSITADGHRESAGIRWLTGTPIGEVPPETPRTYRVPPLYVGPHGCDVCGHGTMEGTFDPTEPCPECGTVYGLDFRRLIAKALAQPGAPTHRGVAYAAADRWGAKPKSAEEALSGWLNGSRPQLPPHAIEAILDALGARIAFDVA